MCEPWDGISAEIAPCAAGLLFLNQPCPPTQQAATTVRCLSHTGLQSWLGAMGNSSLSAEGTLQADSQPCLCQLPFKPHQPSLVCPSRPVPASLFARALSLCPWELWDWSMCRLSISAAVSTSAATAHRLCWCSKQWVRVPHRLSVSAAVVTSAATYWLC